MRFVSSSVLLGGDVFDVVCEFAVFLAQHTVFASVAGAPPDKLPRCGVHLLLTIGKQVLACLELKNGYEIRCIDQRFVLDPFLFAQHAVVGPICQRVDSILNRRGHPQCQDSLRRFGVQTAAERIQ